MITFDADDFCTKFPAFSDGVAYPLATLQMYFDMSSDFISTNDYGYLNGNARVNALYLMTAHITQLATNTANDDQTGVLTAATIDKVTVSLAPPPIKNQFDYWLNQTIYGQQLLALLTIKSIGGFYVSVPTISGFR